MQRYKRRAQVSVELAMAMIGVVILFLGCINTFVWLSQVMAARQRLYDGSRVGAANILPSPTPVEKQVDENWLPRLNILD
jgi:hypothetical protein